MIENNESSPKPVSRHPLLWKVLLIPLFIVLLPLLVAAGFVYLIWTMILYIAIWIVWSPKGYSVLFVHSDSPIWKSYLEQEIFPHIEKKAIFLNWSERKQWKITLAFLAFRHFGGDRNFNPMAMVFRPFRFQRSFRFYEVFRDFKHGNNDGVERMKRQLFDNLRIPENERIK